MMAHSWIVVVSTGWPVRRGRPRAQLLTPRRHHDGAFLDRRGAPRLAGPAGDGDLPHGEPAVLPDDRHRDRLRVVLRPVPLGLADRVEPDRGRGDPALGLVDDAGGASAVLEDGGGVASPS